MTKPKKPEPNPIEEAIGERSKPKTKAEKIIQTPTEVAKQILPKTQAEPSPSEMLALEELNRQTEERLQDKPEETTVMHTVPKVPIIPVSKPDRLPQVVETCSQESPMEDNDDKLIQEKLPEAIQETLSSEEAKPAIKNIREAFEHINKLPAEDIELTALRKYIQEDGFVLATVAFHIVTLCAQPMITPSTTTWDYKDRARVPDMVLALLNQPGYIEGIWPSLKIVMADNKGNAAWCAGIATTIAFFDVVRTLPAIKELSNEKKS